MFRGSMSVGLHFINFPAAPMALVPEQQLGLGSDSGGSDSGVEEHLGILAALNFTKRPNYKSYHVSIVTKLSHLFLFYYLSIFTSISLLFVFLHPSMRELCDLKIQINGEHNIFVSQSCESFAMADSSGLLQKLLSSLIFKISSNSDISSRSSSSSIDASVFRCSSSVRGIEVMKPCLSREWWFQMRMKKVGRMIDKYLREIAPDQRLKVSRFLGVAESLPDSARDCYDGVYRALEIFI